MRFSVPWRKWARSAPSSSRRARPQLEQLEDRTVPSVDGLPAITGAPVTPEGSAYTLTLDPAGHTVDSWTLNWGDNSPVETLPGSATSATHTYADGPLDATISVTATEHSTLPGAVQWSTAAGGNGHYYALTSTVETWTQAENEAVANGGHLVSITSQAEQDFVASTFLTGANFRSTFFIGINDAANPGHYVWTTGEPVAYTNFQAGEPNHYKGVEFYGAINWHFGHNIPGGVLGSWNDTPVDGFNFNATGPELWGGIMEFDTPTAVTTTRTLQIGVQNVAPTASISSSASGAVRGQTITFTLGAQDPSMGDQNAGFTYAIDWNGDGKVYQMVTGGSGTQVSHTFADSGAFNVSVTATDRDMGTSLPAVQSVSIVDAAIQDGKLVIGGTTGNDFILLVSETKTVVHLWINGKDEGVFSPTAGVVVHGWAGNDVITVQGYQGPAELYGDDGDDVFHAGPGDTKVDGGAGNDLVIGGRGRRNLTVTSASFNGGDDSYFARILDRVFADHDARSCRGW